MYHPHSAARRRIAVLRTGSDMGRGLTDMGQGLTDRITAIRTAWQPFKGPRHPGITEHCSDKIVTFHLKIFEVKAQKTNLARFVKPIRVVERGSCGGFSQTVIFGLTNMI